MSNPQPRIVYAGTPEFAARPLEALLAQRIRPVAVYTQPDRPSGRGRKLMPGPVKRVALDAGLVVEQPAGLRDEETLARLAGHAPDLLIVVAYGLILPQAVLDIPTLGCWNVHASLLPRWRGAAPIQRAIEAGDPETGVCVMRMEAGLDTGPVWLCRSTPIGIEDTAASLHDRLAGLGAEALLECLDRLRTGQLGEPQAQDEEQASYAAKVTKAEAKLDWRRDAEQLARQVRAFNPWPVCWFERNGERFRVWRAEARPGNLRFEPGQVVRSGPDGIDIAAAQGVLRILELQVTGGRRMSARDYLNARRFE